MQQLWLEAVTNSQTLHHGMSHGKIMPNHSRPRDHHHHPANLIPVLTWPKITPKRDMYYTSQNRALISCISCAFKCTTLFKPIVIPFSVPWSFQVSKTATHVTKHVKNAKKYQVMQIKEKRRWWPLVEEYNLH